MFKKFLNTLCEIGCIASVVGWWPRFFEPSMLLTTRKKVLLSKELDGLKIVQISDLHFCTNSKKFLKKIINRVNRLSPDIILLTGDFLLHSELKQERELLDFLNSLEAKIGLFCTFGNHDYQNYVSINANGNCEVVNNKKDINFSKALSKIIKKRPSKINSNLKIEIHSSLLAILKKSKFELLENETKVIPINNTFLNICGLGDVWAGQFNPGKAFKNYNKDYPGIVLSHNPDTFLELKKYPGELILSGHTHGGGQLNMPWLSDKLTPIQNKKFKRGFFNEDGKMLYVNRGLGSHPKFRLFAPPEILLITL